MSLEKVDVRLPLAYRLLHPRNVVLVTCVDEVGKVNVITLAWSMPVSMDPPIVAISVAPKRYSHGLIERSKEFVVNVPTMDIVKEALYCGRVSGRRRDKFKDVGLTPSPAKRVKPPIINECIAHLECKVIQQIKVGDHTLFLGEVVAAYVNEKSFVNNKYNLTITRFIYHVGEDEFVTNESRIVIPH